MIDLVAGANLPLTGSAWALTVSFPQDIRHTVGVAVLPVNDALQLVVAPRFAHHTTADWLTAELSADGTCYSLSVDATRLANSGVTRLRVVAYRFGAKGTLSLAAHIALCIANVCRYAMALGDIDAPAMVVAELYLRAGNWKFRALAETSAYGLVVLARRMGMEIDDTSPYGAVSPQQETGAWSGTAFLVAPGVLMTNAHVVDGARHMRLTSLQGTLETEVMISDDNNDLALLRAPLSANLQPLRFRQVGAGLAEAITTLGYPMAGLMGSGVQVTQGVISGLFGAHNDIRLLQFTAPIQPGSSGSPLLDQYGAVLGVVSSTFTQAQNMNFAIRGLLATALMEAANIPCTLQTDSVNLPATQMVSRLQPAIWKVECKA
jgi:S1-C subfamily serine protease